ncbi:MAG: metal-dependent hydrolase [Methanomicrobium sp.]|nr:metal-dependent hydrolase [Methanomicrobium sp.]
MDILTHAFSVMLLGGHIDTFLVCFGVIGTVLPDMDILMQRFFSTDPRLYIFSHGGITHSIAGAVLISLAGFSSVCLLQLTGVFGVLQLPEEYGFWISGFSMMAGGALLHIILDFLAYPGIPLLFPLTDKKYTLGVFPGPSLFLMVASVVFLVLLIAGFTGTGGLYAWGLVFFGLIAFSFIKKGFVAVKFRGKKAIPNFNPLHWILVSEDDNEYKITRYSVTKGLYGESVYKKRDGVGEEEIESLADDPGMRKLRYYSYLVVFERIDGKVRAYDPLRVTGLIFYPPDYREYLFELTE